MVKVEHKVWEDKDHETMSCILVLIPPDYLISQKKIKYVLIHGISNAVCKKYHDGLADYQSWYFGIFPIIGIGGFFFVRLQIR